MVTTPRTPSYHASAQNGSVYIENYMDVMSTGCWRYGSHMERTIKVGSVRTSAVPPPPCPARGRHLQPILSRGNYSLYLLLFFHLSTASPDLQKPSCMWSQDQTGQRKVQKCNQAVFTHKAEISKKSNQCTRLREKRSTGK